MIKNYLAYLKKKYGQRENVKNPVEPPFVDEINLTEFGHPHEVYLYKDKSSLDNRYYYWIRLMRMMSIFYKRYGNKYHDPLEKELENLIMGKNIRFPVLGKSVKLDKFYNSYPVEEKCKTVKVEKFDDDDSSIQIYINGKLVGDGRIRIEIEHPLDPYGEENWE